MVACPPPELAGLEATWATHAAGTTLVHADIRADNLLLTDDGVMVVDWPHACRGHFRGHGIKRRRRCSFRFTERPRLTPRQTCHSSNHSNGKSNI